MKQLHDGEFKLTFKALASETDNQSPFSDEDAPMKIRGLASGMGIDLHNEEMTEAALRAFKQAIQDGVVLPSGEWSLIPLRSGHRNNWDDVLGWLTKAELDGENNLWIEAELDNDSSRARDLYAKLTRPTKPGRIVQLGLSVGGKITKYRDVWNAELSKMVRQLEGVLLDEISVVGAPAYPTAYVTALTKSLERVSKENNDMSDQNEKVTTEDVPMEANPQNVDLQQEVAGKVEGQDAIAIPKQEVVEENVDPSTTARTDPSANAPDSDAAQVATGTEEAAADPQNVNADENKLDTITNVLSELSQAVAELRSQRVSEDVNKSEEAPVVELETPTDVHKALDEDRVKEIVSSVMADALGDLIGEIKMVKSAVDEIANTPVDASLAVRKAKEDERLDPIDSFRTRVSEAKGNSKSIIGQAVRVSLEQR